MLGRDSYDLIIVGGGIVGTTLAVALKNTGLNIAMIEERPLEVAASRRQAYALSLMSSRIFTGLGIWDKISPSIGKFRHIRLSDADYPIFVPFVVDELKTDYLGYVGEHQVILTALHKASQDCDRIDWLSPAKVLEVEYGAETATVTLEEAGQTRKITTKLVIGADGARSAIRQGAQIKTKGWKYWQSCVAFTIKHQLDRNDTAFERFWPTEAKKLQEMPEAEFIKKLEAYTGGLLGKLELVSSRALFPVQLMQSDTYVKPRLALIGDAAHCCHPVGGQGLNLGIRDAAALAQVLKEAVEKQEDIGSLSTLKSYEKWRRSENLAILGFTDFLDRLFSNNWPPIVVIRRLGLAMMRGFPPLKLFALQLMTGLKGRIPQLAR